MWLVSHNRYKLWPTWLVCCAMLFWLAGSGWAGSSKLISPEKTVAQLAAGAEMVGVIVLLTGFQETKGLTLDALKAHTASIKQRQAEVLAWVEDRHCRQVRLFTYIPGFAAQVTSEGLAALEGLDEVATIEPDEFLYPATRQGIDLIEASTIRQQYGGNNLAIAICDSGIDYDHPALGGGFPNAKVIGGYDVGDGDADPMDTYGHGTKVAGCAAGLVLDEGDYIGGVAPGAKLYALKITAGAGGIAQESALLAAWEWVLEHQNDDPANPILVICTSYGSGYFPQECDSDKPALATAAANLTAAGVTIFASSGNDGYCEAVNNPACLSETIGVGAVYDDDIGTISRCVDYRSCVERASTGCSSGHACDDVSAVDLAACYSNTHQGLTEFLAPGYNTTAPEPGGGYDATFGGTSSACAYGAGAAALLQDWSLTTQGQALTPEMVRQRLNATGDLVTDEKSDGLFPRLNVLRAVEDDENQGLKTWADSSPVPRSDCLEGYPSWTYNLSLKTLGVPVTVTQWTIRYFDAGDNLINWEEFSAEDLPVYFDDCAALGGATLSGGTVYCGELCSYLGNRAAGYVEYNFKGLTEAGQAVETTWLITCSPDVETTSSARQITTPITFPLK